MKHHENNLCPNQTRYEEEKLSSAAKTDNGGIFVEYFEPKPSKPDKHEIQPLNKVSVFEDFCVLTKSLSCLSQSD